MKTKLCAKDKKFEEERIAFRRQIKALQNELELSDCVIKNLKRDISDKDSQIAQLKQTIEKLLEYTNISKEDMHELIQKDIKLGQVIDKLMPMLYLFDRT